MPQVVHGTAFSTFRYAILNRNVFNGHSFPEVQMKPTEGRKRLRRTPLNLLPFEKCVSMWKRAG